MGTFTGDEIIQLNETMNKNHYQWYWDIPAYILIGDILSAPGTKPFKLYTNHFNAANVRQKLDKIVPGNDFEPEDTHYTLTKIWLSFVSENWPCNDGTLEELPDLLSTTEDGKSLAEEEIGKIK